MCAWSSRPKSGSPSSAEIPIISNSPATIWVDVSFVRIYDKGKPFDSSADFLPFAKQDAADGDLTFTSGNPGSTERWLDTVAELRI